MATYGLLITWLAFEPRRNIPVLYILSVVWWVVLIWTFALFFTDGVKKEAKRNKEVYHSVDLKSVLIENNEAVNDNAN